MSLKKIGICASIFLLSSCSKSTMMTMETFEQIQIGTPIQIVMDKNGDPVAIDSQQKPSEYKYVEKITSGNHLLYENHFMIFVQDGKVVGKTAVQERIPAYDLIYQDDPNHHQYP